GRLWENDLMRIVVADELSPDSCRLWDIKSNEKLDKDRFRRDLGGLVEAYAEVAKRLGIMSEGERPQGTGPGLVKGESVAACSPDERSDVREAPHFAIRVLKGVHARLRRAMDARKRAYGSCRLLIVIPVMPRRSAALR